MSISKQIRNLLPDKMYLKIMYKKRLGKKLNLKNPQTFNEKLQWLKLYDRKPEYSKMVDKYEAKEYAAKVIGEEHIIKTYGVWDKFDDIEFDKLPNQFVLKCTHDSGGIVICTDKEKLDMTKAKEKIEKSLKNNYYYEGREWPYKNVKPRIIAEEYMEDKTLGELRDYKFYCFDGKADYVMVCVDRKSGHPKFYYMDRTGKIKKEMSFDGMALKEDIKIIDNAKLKEMFNIAEKLSNGYKFLRIDLYNVDGEIYFGEYTFFPSAGFDNTRPEFASDYLDKMLKLGGK